jgi:hypothetical protein
VSSHPWPRREPLRPFYSKAVQRVHRKTKIPTGEKTVEYVSDHTVSHIVFKLVGTDILGCRRPCVRNNTGREVYTVKIYLFTEASSRVMRHYIGVDVDPLIQCHLLVSFSYQGIGRHFMI